MNEIEHPTPGVRVERREALKLGGLLAALPLAGSLAPRWGQADREPRDPIDGPRDAFEEFAALWKELAETYLEPTPELEEPYLYRLASHITAQVLDAVPPRQRKVFESPSLATGPAWFMGPIFIVVLTVEPGAVIAPHNHPGHNVVTVGLSGSAHYRHYELRGETPPFEDHATRFRVQETRRGILRRGRTSHLARHRDNIHTFQAGAEGAVLLDFTTELGGREFGMLAIDEPPLDAFHGVHEAHWKEHAW